MLDNMFGIVLTLPGAVAAAAAPRELAPDALQQLGEVARYYLGEARGSGFILSGLNDALAIERILRSARSPGDVEDIIVLAQTTARYRQRMGAAKAPEITPDIIEKSIRRVIVSPVA